MRVLWRCPDDPAHEWVAAVNDRFHGNGCPVHRANGWNRAKLAHFLSTAWNVLTQVDDERARRAIFEAAGALRTPRRQQSVMEAIIAGELADEDVIAYIAGEDTAVVEAVLAGHQSHPFGGKDPIPASLRALVYARDGNACLACGSTARLSCDHYPVPESLGGKTEFGNLRALCMPCNQTSGVKALSIKEIRARRRLDAA
jgi:HNH endonuclease